MRCVITDRILHNTINTGLFTNFNNSKLIALGLLVISLVGSTGKKSDELHPKIILVYLVASTGFFFASAMILQMDGSIQKIALSFIVVTAAGYLCVLAGGSQLSRLIHVKLSKDVFNELNETFPQEKRLIQNEYSINYRARYLLKNKVCESFINVINPFRGSIVCGTPGAGKSWFIILPLIKQMIEKGYALFIYDFKYDDLKCPNQPKQCTTSEQV